MTVTAEQRRAVYANRDVLTSLFRESLAGRAFSTCRGAISYATAATIQRQTRESARGVTPVPRDPACCRLPTAGRVDAVPNARDDAFARFQEIEGEML